MRAALPCAAALLAVAVGCGSPGGTDPAAEQPSTASSPPPPMEAMIAGPPPEPVELTPWEAAATSTCPKFSTPSPAAASNNPVRVFVDDPAQAWVTCRGAEPGGEVTMNIVFARPVRLQSATVVPGWNYVEPDGVDEWAQRPLVTKVRWNVDGRRFVQNIGPERAGSVSTFPSGGVDVDRTMSMTILDADAGWADARDDGEVAIGRIVLKGVELQPRR
ncbi:hypothetical protein MKOR_12580 [Mycolicibacillus koreensis]|nr:hypothetical protein MKOR_12580 [Mycolicibacillus koreensis]